MTSINTIFLDLDGVCNRLIMHALEWHGFNVSRYDDSGWPVLGSYSVNDAVAALDPNSKLTGDEIFQLLPVEVWASTPPSDEFFKLLTWCELLAGRENVAFMTRPVGQVSAAGKVLWIERFAPRWLRNQFFVGTPKYLTARPDALLIDDSDAEVTGFRRRGGCALLVPRPWNSEYQAEPGQKIDRFFQSLLQEKNQVPLPLPEPGKFAALKQSKLLPSDYHETWQSDHYEKQ